MISWSGLISRVGVGSGNLLLAHGAHHLAHAGAGFVLVRDDDGGAVGEAERGADFLDGVAEGGLDFLEQGLEVFGLFGLARGGVVLEVVAGVDLLTDLRSMSPYLSTVEKTISSMSSSRRRTSMSFFL